MQSKKGTVIEILWNTGIGIIGSWVITYTVMHFNFSPAVAATLSCVLCTIWSIVRGYSVRRYFNKKEL